MCNLSTGIYNKGYNKGSLDGYNKGSSAGYDKGSSDGKIKQAKETVYRLKQRNIPLTEIAYIVDESVATVQEWLTEPQASPAT